MKAFDKDMAGKYFVLRTFSRTNTRELWRVMTRPISDITLAGISQEVEKRQCSAGQEVFIVKIVSQDDNNEIYLSRQITQAWHAGYKAAIEAVLEGRHCKGGLEPFVPLKK